MAEGGVEDMTKAFETVKENMCEICLDDDSFKQAPWFCKLCSQYLCDMCKKYHRRVSTTKSHEIIHADEIQSFSSLAYTEEQLSDEYRPSLCPRHNKPLEFYCEDCNVPVCDFCKQRTVHMRCTHFPDLEQVVTENKGKYKETVHHLRAIDAGMDKIREALEIEKDLMKSNTTASIQKINQKMKILENLGQTKVLEVAEIMTEENKIIERETEVLIQSKALVSKSIDELEKSSRAGSEDEICLAARYARMQAVNYQELLFKYSSLTHRSRQFEVNSHLENIDSFGNITMEKSTVLLDQTPQIINFLNVNDYKRVVTWFDMLPNGQISLLTRGVDPRDISQLRLYSASKCLLDQVNMSTAISAATINTNQIVVPIQTENHLKVVNTDNNKLEQQCLIKTEGSPVLISEYSNKSVLIVVKHEKRRFCFQLIDLDGRVLNQSADLADVVDVAVPTFMIISTDRQVIYITDRNQGIFGFNLQGDLIHHFTQQSCDWYVGLALDEDKSLYYAAELPVSHGWRLIKLSPIGDTVKPIAYKLDLCAPLKYADGKLYIYSDFGILAYIFI